MDTELYGIEIYWILQKYVAKEMVTKSSMLLPVSSEVLDGIKGGSCALWQGTWEERGMGRKQSHHSFLLWRGHWQQNLNNIFHHLAILKFLILFFITIIWSIVSPSSGWPLNSSSSYSVSQVFILISTNMKMASAEGQHLQAIALMEIIYIIQCHLNYDCKYI